MNIIDIVLIIVFFINVIFSTLIFIHRKESSGSIFFTIAAYNTALWVFAMFLFRNISGLNILIIPTKLLYIAGILITTNFLYFSYTFLGDSIDSPKKKRNLFWLISFLPTISIALIIFSKTIIKRIEFLDGEKIVQFGSLYIFYSILMFVYFLLAYFNLFQKFRKFITGSIQQTQLLYVVVGTLISVIIGLIYDIIIPYFGFFYFYWFGPVMTIIFVTATSYAIFKHHLFNIRVIATELLTLSIWIFLLIRLFVNPTLEALLINGSLFVLVVIFGIILIKSVLNEVKQREQLEKLSADLNDLKTNLEAKVVQQTTEIKKAYEVEKKARIELEELDEAKDQFVLTTQHHLRTPLTIIKGYLAVIKEKFSLPKEAVATLDKMQESTEIIARSVNDLLQATEVKVREK